jgi:signal transduction histidine kinase/ActR/RegA family two-component response regulator
VASTPLRRRLFVLTAAAILPLAVLAGIGLYRLRAHQIQQAERVGVEFARSVANAVDAEFRSAISVLEALSTTPSLDTDDYEGFRDRARRVLAVRPDWRAIVLYATNGTLLVDTRHSGGPTAEIQDRDSFDRAVRTRAPTVGGLKRHEPGGWVFSVRVPVVRGATVTHVVTAFITPEPIRQVLTRQQLPDDWVVSIVDASGVRVARSRAHDENLGGRLSPTAQAVVAAGGPEGFGVSYTLEGARIFTPYSRLASTGWTTVLGLPTTLVEAAALRALGIYGGGLLLSLALATLGALWVARTITRPIADLRAAAEAVGRRARPALPATSIQEIREVGAALAAAADDLARGEAERDDLLRKERLAREAAEAADRAKDEFLAVLSHELRTPLNAVYGWAKMLQNKQVPNPATAARAIHAIVRNADMQMQLIDDLLDFSRISSGRLRLDTRRLDLRAVVRDALDAVRPPADAKHIRIDARLDPVAAVVGDPGRLQQVCWNLLMNAVKFTPEGGEVRVALREDGARCQLVISDNGQGIGPDLLPHVFERFRQADSSSTRPHSGLGLGLALVQHLVDLHGGTVAAESGGEGQGATFTVTLPAAPSLSDPPVRPPLAASLDPPAAVARLDGLRVLVVDDDQEGAELAATILARAGAEVRSCDSAATALGALIEWRPDVLVSDIEMPGEDGYTLIRNVRALAAANGGATPAIALTAYGRPQDRVRALAAGFNMHVPKPVDPGELTAIVAGIAGEPERAGGE